ncbi:hypothetical protein Srut_50970 [Streptomyces rutgersensis]|nr:hypothetical protein Srut_50970 [Streptomyces rutgersensis]
MPGHRRVVRVAYGDQAARRAHPAHLAQRAHRVAEVLEHLVGVDDVEGGVGEGEGLGVAGAEGGVGQGARGGGGAGRVEDLLGVVDPGDVAVRDQGGEVGGDRPRSAPDVQDAVVRLQRRQQVRGGIGGGTPGVGAQDGLVVAVCVDDGGGTGGQDGLLGRARG